MIGERDRLAALLRNMPIRLLAAKDDPSEAVNYLIAAGVTLREPGAPITEVSEAARRLVDAVDGFDFSIAHLGPSVQIVSALEVLRAALATAPKGAP